MSRAAPRRTGRSGRVAGSVLLLCAGGTACRAPAGPPPPPAEIVVADFEGEGFESFVATGPAFGAGPASGARPGQRHVTGYEGRGFASSHARDPALGTGRLVSAPFTLARPYLALLVGGKHAPESVSVRLLVDGQAVRTVTGNAGPGFPVDHLAWVTWDVRALRGAVAQLELVDDDPAPDAHLLVDHVVLRDRPPLRRDLSARLCDEAAGWAARNAPRPQAEPERPRFHFTAPVGWLGEPSGPVWHDGAYHLFYRHDPFQHLPEAGAPARAGWGRARSGDLARWEHLPWLPPDLDAGEATWLAGSPVATATQELRLLHASVGLLGSALALRRARADGGGYELLAAPRLPPAPGERAPPPADAPFVFRHAAAWYLVHGGQDGQGRGTATLWRARDDGLATWERLGDLATGPDPDWARPVLVPLSGRWLLLYTTSNGPRYRAGTLDLDAGRFAAHSEGTMEAGTPGALRAPTVMPTADGRALLWGWLPGARAAAWSGALSVPRELALDAAGRLQQRPAPELDVLRGSTLHTGDVTLKDGAQVLPGVRAGSYDLTVHLMLGDARRAGLKLRRSRDGGRGMVLAFDGLRLIVEQQVVPLSEPARELDLRVVVDRDIVELFADGGRIALSRTSPARPEDDGLELFAAGGQATFGALVVHAAAR